MRAQRKRSITFPVLCFLLIHLSFPSLSWAEIGGSPLSQEDQIIHLLNRLGFGPRPGDVEKVTKMGIQAYIERQLHPRTVSDAVVERKLAAFETLTMSPKELNELYPSARQMRRLSDRSESTDTARTDRRRPATPDREKESSPEAMSPDEAEEVIQKIQKGTRRIRQELSQARLIRAVDSERQLQEVMVDFWMNHFNIFMPKGLDRVYTTDFEENVIRPQVFGNFEDLLMATAKSPAMLFYLDNWISSAPAEVMEERISQLRSAFGGGSGPRQRGNRMTRRQRAMIEERFQGARRVLGRAKGLNENYARELMELHTLGVDGGYTQEDVIQVARALTGWTIQGPQQGGGFHFQPVLHEAGDKTVLGHHLASGGIEEGEQIIRILAHHPSTARFISSKLVRRFVADDPPDELVDAASQTFLRTGGDIREVLKSIFNHPLFFSPVYHQAKVKKPLELVASSLRSVSAQVSPTRHLVNFMALMGEALYLCQAPTGFPDVASAWINTNTLLTRLNFSLVLASSRIPQVRIDLDSAAPLFAQLRLPQPTEEQLEQTRALLNEASVDDSRPGRGRQIPLSHPVIQAAFMLGSPKFQKR
ncbi:MAG: DUF1800 domain-containing protein [Acidobacteriota bacterium]